MHTLLILTKLVTYTTPFSFICFSHLNMYIRRQLHKLSYTSFFFCAQYCASSCCYHITDLFHDLYRVTQKFLRIYTTNGKNVTASVTKPSFLKQCHFIVATRISVRNLFVGISVSTVRSYRRLRSP